MDYQRAGQGVSGHEGPPPSLDGSAPQWRDQLYFYLEFHGLSLGDHWKGYPHSWPCTLFHIPYLPVVYLACLPQHLLHMLECGSWDQAPALGGP